MQRETIQPRLVVVDLATDLATDFGDNAMSLLSGGGVLTRRLGVGLDGVGLDGAGDFRSAVWGG